MKFHHLARRDQSLASGHSDPRDMSPIKQLHHLQQQQQQQTLPAALVANQLNQHLINMHLAQQQQQQHQQASNGNISDDEEDEVDEEDDEVDDEDFDSSLAPPPTTAAAAAAAYLTNNHQHQQHTSNNSSADGQHMTNTSSSNNGGTNNGFLMDKNKKLFPQKLWELIHNPSIQHCLRWSQDGQRVYLNRNEFEQYYLKTPNNQFHTQKAISFVRQMNMYGFRKVDDCYYENDNFRRDRKHLLKNMIRRHPNKGLFVGLDHHQLAAAAAAQQALQVNQQLQQLENQHKQRAEQALRLNSYLNSHQHHHNQQQHHQQQHHQHNHFQTNFAAAAAAAAAASAAAAAAAASNQQAHHQHHQQHQLKTHPSSPFEQMSSQFAQVAANHFTQQQQQLQLAQQQQQIGENLTTTHQANQIASANTKPLSQANQTLSLVGQQQMTNSSNSNKSPPVASHQPKKSRLLNDFYASNNNNNHSSDQQQQQQHLAGKSNADFPQHLGFNLNSLGALDLKSSPSTNAMTFNSFDQKIASRSSPSMAVNNGNGKEARTQFNLQNNSNSMRNLSTQHSEFSLNCSSNQSSLAAARQAALHETLVRSLLQLKHSQQSHDLVASLQKHQSQSQRSLLESLASLSSGGTGSIVDPASNSPTERTATPPSGPPSPSMMGAVNLYDTCGNSSSSNNNNNNNINGNDDDNNMALNLAKSSPTSSSAMLLMQQANCALGKLSNGNNGTGNNLDDADDFTIEVDDDHNDLDHRADHMKGTCKHVNDDHNDGSDDDCDTTRRNGCVNDVDHMAGSPLDGTKKVRKFLEDQMSNRAIYDDDDDADHDDHDNDVDRKSRDNHHDRVIGDRKTNNVKRVSIKRELSQFDGDGDDGEDARAGAGIDSVEADHIKVSNCIKRFKIGTPEIDQVDMDSLARLLVTETCSRRGHQLDESALCEAVKYTLCFLGILIDDASLIASHSVSRNDDGVELPKSTVRSPIQQVSGALNDDETITTTIDDCGKLKPTDSDETGEKVENRKELPKIDTSSLSLALKLIPTKLIAAIQQSQGKVTEVITSQAE